MRSAARYPLRHVPGPVLFLVSLIATSAIAGPVSVADCDVGKSQALLKALGHDPGPADGLWGGATRKAVTAFQSSHNLAPFGSLNRKTCDELAISIVKAASRGDNKTVVALLAAGAGVDDRQPGGTTALGVAAQNGHLDAVRTLLAANAALDVQTSEGSTPLYVAAKNGHVGVVEILLAAGAAPDLRRENGATPLLLAGQKGNTAIVRALLAGGADIEKRGPEGNTALAFAANFGHADVARALLSAKAAVDTQSHDGSTPLMLAAAAGHREIVDAMLEHGAAIDLQRSDGGSALGAAAQNGHTEIVRALLATEAEVDMISSGGTTPLISAAAEGHLEVVELLLAHGADFELRRGDGASALGLAAQFGHAPVVAALLRAKAEIDAQAENGATALILASGNGHQQVVSVLVAAGAAVDVQADANVTALMVATEAGHRRIVDALLKAGARTDLQAADGATALHSAADNGRAEIVTSLVEASADLWATNTRGEIPLQVATSEPVRNLLIEAMAKAGRPATAEQLASTISGYRVNLGTKTPEGTFGELQPDGSYVFPNGTKLTAELTETYRGGGRGATFEFTGVQVGQAGRAAYYYVDRYDICVAVVVGNILSPCAPAQRESSTGPNDQAFWRWADMQYTDRRREILRLSARSAEDVKKLLEVIAVVPNDAVSSFLEAAEAKLGPDDPVVQRARKLWEEAKAIHSKME